MIVEEIMSKKITTISPEATIWHAIRKMKENSIRHLPVVNESFNLIGLISDRDVRDGSPSILLKGDNELYDSKIKTIMTTNIITGTPLDFVEDVASIFYEYKIGCLPILANEKLVGIITESDMLKTFIQITGASEPSSHIEIRLAHKAGNLCKITNIFQRLNINILNILLYPSNNESFKRLVIRIPIMSTDDLVEELLEKGYEVLWPTKK